MPSNPSSILIGLAVFSLTGSPVRAPAQAPGPSDPYEPAPTAVAPALLAQTSPPPLPSEPQFYYSSGGKPTGPLSLAELQAKVAAGAIMPDTLVWKFGTPGWVAAKDVPELSAPAPQPPAPQPPAVQQTQAPVAAIPVVRQWTKFTDPQEHAFTVDVPQNWKDTGGTNRLNALQARTWVRAISPDGETLIAMNDPNEGSYDAAPMLPLGSIYNAKGALYTVEPAQTGQQYSASWGQRWFASLCSGPKVVENRSRPDLTQKINTFASIELGVTYDVGEATFSCTRNGIEMTAYDLAIMLYIQGGIWYYLELVMFLAPSKVAGIAATELAHMARSAQVDLNWLARGSNQAAAVAHAAAQTDAAISDTIMQGWESRGATMDSIMNQDSRTRLGIDIYSDPTTGDQYTVDNNHNYYWVNSTGAVVGTDTDTAPNGYRRLSRVPP